MTPKPDTIKKSKKAVKPSKGTKGQAKEEEERDLLGVHLQGVETGY